MIERTLGSVIFVESEVFRSPSFAVFFMFLLVDI